MYRNTVFEDDAELATIVAIRSGESDLELARSAQSLGSLGVKRIVFDNPELALRWMNRVAARRESLR